MLMNYHGAGKLLTEDLTSTVYARVTVEECKETVHEGAPQTEEVSSKSSSSQATQPSSCKVLKDSGRTENGVYQIQVMSL